jgi:hypothetical protein
MKVEDCFGKDYVLCDVKRKSPGAVKHLPRSSSGVWK